MGASMKSKFAWIVSVVGLIAFAMSMIARAQGPSDKFNFVRGIVVATILSPTERFKEIALPRARVLLVRPNALDVPLAAAFTDLSGRFVIKIKQSGTFVLCVEADDFKRICDQKQFAMTAPAVSYGNLRIPAPTDSAAHAIAYGKVTLQDGQAPRRFEPAMGVNAYPTVTLTTKSGVTYKGYVNNFGEYIVPRFPIKEEFAMRVSIEKLSRETGVGGPEALAKLVARRGYEFNVRLPNSAPRIRIVSAMSAGKPVQLALPGSDIVLNAVSEDPDNDKLQYRWLLPDGKVVGPTADPVLKWKAPASGNHLFTVLVSDERGGYARAGIAIRVSTGNVTFSGRVVDTAGQAIGSAQVDVNSRLVNTNSRGQFRVNVPVADKYMMNIRKLGLEAPNQPGYGTGSYVYSNAIKGGRWVLHRAQVVTVNPAQPIIIQQRRDPKDCGGMVASTLNWTGLLKPELFHWQDGRGNVCALPDLGADDPKAVQNVIGMLGRIHPSLVKPMADATKIKQRTVEQRPVPCTPGIKVEIPANSLIDPVTNALPSGSVQIALSTVALNAPGQMPGDFSADDGGKAVSLESLGAGSIDIGAGTRRYNLRSDATATVTIAVDGTQTAGNAVLPAKVPFLYYNERQGIWQREGDADLNASGDAYVRKVRHFSPMNADIQKQGESCVAIEVDQNKLTLPFHAEVVMQPSKVNPGVLQVRDLLVDSPNNVIYNLPNMQNIVVTPIISGVLPDGSMGLVPAGVFVVNTGGPQTTLTKPPTPNADGTYYAEMNGMPTGPCASRLTLTKLDPVSIANPYEFLQGLHLQSTNINEFAPGSVVETAIDQGSVDYYKYADPLNLRDTFNKFKAKNKFGMPLAAGDAEWNAPYANSGDLGFGRDMHCRRNKSTDPNDAPNASDYACYVTNYGQPPANIADQDDADHVVTPGFPPDATVAMEYSRVEFDNEFTFPDNNRAVKFYVYNTSAPDAAPPIRKADLDGVGARPVPQLCMVCHGGTLASTLADPNDPNPDGPKKGAFADRADILSMQSNFLPFDLHFFTLPTGQNKTDAAVQDSFKKLNIDIVRGVAVANGVTGAAILDVIDNALYAGNSATQLDNTVVPGWDTGNANSPPNRFYRDVFARACRTCHTAGPFGAMNFANRTDFEADIGTVQDYVCNKKVMPHALRTNNWFWSSLAPNMAAYLQLYGESLPGWNQLPQFQCGQFQGGGIAPSVFASQIDVILFSNCNSCHAQIGLANFGVSAGLGPFYNQLLNNNTLPGAGNPKYIVPNSTGTSWLYHRITTGGVGVRMPRFGADLVSTDTDIPMDNIPDAAEISTWINSGAPGP